MTREMAISATAVQSPVRQAGPPPARSDGALARRTARIVLAILLIWVLNIADLGATLSAHKGGQFVELNPLARSLLQFPPALIAFKLIPLALASLVFIISRRHFLTEFACLLVCVMYVVLGIIWWSYGACLR